MDSKIHNKYEIRWKNYRGFADTDWLDICPITILIGPNNSGKSSVMSPLLLLKQTVNSDDTKTPLISHGELVDIGSYKDYVHAHDKSKKIFFGLRFDTHDKPKDCSPVGNYRPGAVELTFAGGAKPDQLKLLK